jgi:replicative DNA helicase
VTIPVDSDPAGKLPPQNPEAEASVLGAILFNEQSLDGILIDVKLRPEDFYRERHRLIYRSIIRLRDKQEPEAVDVLTVSEDLGRRGELEEAGGRNYVQSLPMSVPVPGNAKHYAKIVKDHALMRALLGATQEIQASVYNFPGSPRDLVGQAEAQLFKIAHDDKSSDLRAIGEVLHDELDRLERVSREGIAVTGTPSGFKDLDDLTGGFQPGNLIVLAARPGMGKSALVTNMAENAAITYAKPVLLFSLEMAETELAQRFVASQAKMDGDDLRKGRVRQDRWPKIVRATQRLAAAPLFVDDSSDLGVLELRAKARRLHARQELGLVIVDYLQLMRPEDPTVNRVEQIGGISRGLKLLARELQIPVIAVSQLSRAVESRPDKRPLLSDLRESGQIEQDADVVMFIFRDEYYTKGESERPGEADLIVAKHRNGPVGEVELTFMPRYPKFATLLRDHAFDGAVSAESAG